jgi:glyoxylase-like metal-dependent hydrolase (beta-lactamase superfamily II)
MLVFRQLFDEPSSTYTYLLGDRENGQAILIDPVFEQVKRELALLHELDLSLKVVLDTHCHADHVTAAWLLKQRSNCEIAAGLASGISGVDLYLADGDSVCFGQYKIKVLSTPGHTNGCTSYLLDSHSKIFTGDTLLIRGCGRTDFQEGSPASLYQSVRNKIFTLPSHTEIYPAHDYRGLTSTSVGEEKQHNPRLGGRVSEADFVGYMNNLNLPYPKNIDFSVPANLVSGEPENKKDPFDERQWGPLRYTFAGFWEIEAYWLQENLDKVCVVDVREMEECSGPLGFISGSMLIPLDQLKSRLGEIPRDKPLVTVCRAGSRSARASLTLQESGFSQVANLTGGMLGWCSLHHVPSD